MKRFLPLIVLALHASYSFSAIFVSHSTGPWNGGTAVWSIVGSDADNIPDSDDDVAILFGDSISLVSGASQSCNSLLINDGGMLRGGFNYATELKIFGNYTNEGSEDASRKGTLTFRGTGTTISGSGTFAGYMNWQFTTDRTIAADVTATKERFIRLHSGAALTNQGNFTVNDQVIAYWGLSEFINEGTLTIGHQDFMSVGTFDASFPGNTVNIRWTLTTLSTLIPRTTSGFHHLNIQNGSTQIAEFQQNETINGNFANNSGQVQFSTFDIIVMGDYSNSGGTIGGGNSLSFNGTGTQVLSNSVASSITFPCSVTVGASSTTVATRSLICNHNLTINGILDMNASTNNLTVRGNLVFDGSYVHNNNNLVFSGTSAQTITAGSTLNVYNMQINNQTGVSLTSGSISLTNLLAFTNGILDVSGGSFTVLSDATQTGNIGQLCSTCGVTGTVTMQRFIPAGSADFRDLASPFVSGTTFEHWDDELIISCDNCPDGCAYGGAGSGCYASIKYFDDATQTYFDVDDITDDIINLRGYEAFLADNTSNFSGATIEMSGTINGTGALTHVIPIASWSLIGNPYCSAIDADLFSHGTSIGAYFYIYDSGTGNFEYYDIETGTSSGAVNSNGIITPGQGFWMKSGNSTGVVNRSIVFSQNQKSTSSADFVRNTNATLAANRFDLRVTNLDNSFSCKSALSFEFDAENGFDTYDIELFRGPERPTVKKAPMLWYKVDSKDIRYNKLAYDDQVKRIIPLAFNSEISGRFKIDAISEELFDVFACILLYDSKTGLYTDLRTHDYIFDYAGQNSDSDRFQLILSNEGMCDILENTDVALNQNGFSIKSTIARSNLRIEIIDNGAINNGTDNTARVTIYSLTGQRVFTDTYHTSMININPYFMSSGAYLIQVEKNGAVQSDKVVLMD